jgi:hypothetical protein
MKQALNGLLIGHGIKQKCPPLAGILQQGERLTPAPAYRTNPQLDAAGIGQGAPADAARPQIERIHARIKGGSVLVERLGQDPRDSEGSRGLNRNPALAEHPLDILPIVPQIVEAQCAPTHGLDLDMKIPLSKVQGLTHLEGEVNPRPLGTDGEGRTLQLLGLLGHEVDKGGGGHGLLWHGEWFFGVPMPMQTLCQEYNRYTI